MLAKAKQSDIKTLNKVIDEVFPYIGTSITEKQALDLVTGIMSYELKGSCGFPIRYNFYSTEAKGSCIAAVDLNDNVKTMQKFLFGTDNYVPTTTVQNISAQLTAETGYTSEGVIPVPSDDPNKSED